MYTTLWVVIGAVYVAVATGLGLIAGARFPVEVAIALTVVATLLFQPARRRLESVADRIVFGRRDSPVEAIQSFGAALGPSSGPRDVAGELARVAHRIVGGVGVRVDIAGSQPAVAGVWADGDVTVVDIGWGAEQYGTLTCVVPSGEQIADDDRAVLGALAAQAGLSISHARLAARMVTAEESERRRIERDIHDGVQQDLATQIGQLALVRARANGDAELAESLDQLRVGMARTLAEIRDLAQGIHPSVLRDAGLVAAIEDRCQRLPLPVSIDVSAELAARRFDEATEAAVYFAAAEAIANVVKHAGAGSVRVEIGERDDAIHLAVTDDGCGFDPSSMTEGSGIRGLSDRLRALGGDVAVDSAPGQGTTVVVSLPVGAGT